jgi:hypothetical protein
MAALEIFIERLIRTVAGLGVGAAMTWLVVQEIKENSCSTKTTSVEHSENEARCDP